MPDPENTYPGERLRLPPEGPGSIARFGRRVGALVIDWGAATVIAMAFFGYRPFDLPEEAGLTQFAPLLVFAAIQVVFIPFLAGSPGHRIAGMRVELASGGWTGIWRPMVRSALLVLAIPALIWDTDHRGLHDKAAGTVLVRA